MIGAIIAARMGSRRLPGKVMMELGGRPMLGWVLDAVRSSCVDDLRVVVTPDPRDQTIVDFCNDEQVECVVGSDNRDVLGDFYNVAQECGFDPIVRVTADCPLLSPYVINSVVNLYLEGDSDYCTNALDLEHRTYPRGLDTEVFSFVVLEWMHHSLREDVMEPGLYHPDYRKHVTLYLREDPSRCRVAVVNLNVAKLRLVVDTQDEYDNLSTLFALMEKPDWTTVLGLANVFPELVSLETPTSQTPAKGRVY